jgi:hypothetical protein
VTEDEIRKISEKENLMYFEVSALKNLNIKMLFSNSIIELPFFDDYVINQNARKHIIEEIENEGEDKEENSIIDIIKGKNTLNIHTEQNEGGKNQQNNSNENKKSNCNC